MLYTSDGWLNVKHILSFGLTTHVIIGGRAVGKTYGVLYESVQENINTILMRRSQTQLDMIANADFSPYNVINEDMGLKLPLMYFRENKNVYNLRPAMLNEKEVYVPAGPCQGYGMALSTVKNLRGFSARDVKWLVFDEFIPEHHEHEIKQEAMAFHNAYETINRNRELQGEEPVKVFLLANANNLASDIIVSLGLVPVIDKMASAGMEEWIDTKRKIGVWLLQNSPISERKKGTGLYAVAGDDFINMALNNRFTIDHANIRPMPIKEYRPISTIAGLVFYKHKSNGSYYVTTHKSGSPKEYPFDKMGVLAWKREHTSLINAFYRYRLYFETKYCQIIFTKSLF